jgi:hypothetical protein
MAYIGNTPEISFNTLTVQKFNGTGACTQFTISQPVSDPNYLEILVNNVQQEPYAAYDVASGVITFTEAPSVGANNIQVGVKSSTIIYYNVVYGSQIVDNTITAGKIQDNSITGGKLQDGSISDGKFSQSANNKIASSGIVGSIVFGS